MCAVGAAYYCDDEYLYYRGFRFRLGAGLSDVIGADLGEAIGIGLANVLGGVLEVGLISIVVVFVAFVVFIAFAVVVVVLVVPPVRPPWWCRCPPSRCPVPLPVLPCP